MKTRFALITLWGQSKAFLWLLIASMSTGVVVAKDQFAKVAGTITWHTGAAPANIGNARVQVLDPDPKLLRSRKILVGTKGDRAGHYQIENLEEGLYEVVACADDFLAYEPKLQTVQIRRNETEIDFALWSVADRISGITFPAEKWKVMYLKEKDTGCESGPIQPDRSGIFRIKNLTEGRFRAEYVYCLDTEKETDENSAPFESCIRKQITIGLPVDQLMAWVAPRKIKRKGGEQIYTYEFATVTILNGKVSDFKIGIQPNP
jgi:hypothetical protein